MRWPFAGEMLLFRKHILLSIHHLNDAEKIWANLSLSKYKMHENYLVVVCWSGFFFYPSFLCSSNHLSGERVKKMRIRNTQWRMNPSKVCVHAVHSLSFKCIPTMPHWISICSSSHSPPPPPPLPFNGQNWALHAWILFKQKLTNVHFVWNGFRT